MKVYAIGASRNIGYGAALRLLKAGHYVTFLLRNPSAFDDNNDIAPFIASKHARLIKGDALNMEEMRQGLADAESDGPIDTIVYSVGGVPSFSVTKGFMISPPNLCTSGIFNLLSILSKRASQPHLLVVTSHGMTTESHSTLPFPVKILHKAIHQPHQDKLAAERIIHHCAGWEWKDKVQEDLLPPNWQEGLPAPGWLKSVTVVRPALLTDGACKADKGGSYRVGEAVNGAWSVSREDVSHFVADCVLNWGKYENKGVSIAY